MRITWFGDSVFRIVIGDDILVIDPDRAGPDIDAAELVAGASRTVSSATAGAPIAGETLARWRPRQTRRAIDMDESPADLLLWRLAPGAVLIDAPGEAGLVIALAGASLPTGRWADGAILLGVGPVGPVARTLQSLVETARPAMLVLAAPGAPDAGAFADALGAAGQGLAVQSLEPGLALEV